MQRNDVHNYNLIINACAIRWLPKWKGLASGVVVSGFGLGAVLFAYTQTLFINPKNYIPEENEGYFTHPDVLSRVPSSFLVFGGVHMVMQVAGSLFLTKDNTLQALIQKFRRGGGWTWGGKRRWVQEGDVPPPAQSAEVFLYWQ